MKDKIIEFFGKIAGSFDTTKGGFSARKLTAFVGIVMVVVIDVKWLRSDQWQYIEMILGLHFTFILALFGLTTWGKKSKEDETTDSDITAN